MDPKKDGTLFAYCEKCKTLFMGLRGKAFIHPCGPTVGRSNFETTYPPNVEIPVQWAKRVEELT